MWHFLLDLREQRKYLTWLKLGDNHFGHFPLRIFSGHLNTWCVATHPHPSPKFKQSRVKTNLHTMSGHQLFRCLSCIRDLASSCSCCWGSAVRVWRCSHVLVLVMGPHHPGIFHSGIPHLVRFWQKHYYSNVDVEIDSNLYSSSLE